MRRWRGGRLRRVWLPVLAGALAALVAAADAQNPPPIPTPSYTSDVEVRPLAESRIYADIPFASAHAEAPRVPSAPDAWGGERTGDEPTLSDRVVSYRIDAKLDAARHRINASQVMTWRNRSAQPVTRVYFYLYLNAFQNDESTWATERRTLAAQGGGRGGAALRQGEWGWIELSRITQGGRALKWSFVHPDGGPKTDQTVAAVTLAEPVPPGGTLTLDMAFESQLPRVVERTGWYGAFNLVAQWFPKIGVLELAGERGATGPRWNVHEFHFNSEFYADFGSFDVRLTVPNDYTVGAVGHAAEPPQSADGMTTYHFVQDDVHDFAWVAAQDFRTLDGTWRGKDGKDVALRVIYPAEYAASAAPTLGAMGDALAYFSRTLGAYPYRTVTAVIPPYNAEAADGMEYPTFYTAAGYARVEPGTTAKYALDFTNIHEFGHGYFYGILASNEFEEPILDEGVNEYWDDRMLDDRGQLLHLASPLMKRLGLTFTADNFVIERVGAHLAHPADPLGQDSWNRLSSASYASVYRRTALAMHDLEARVGKDAMDRGMREYYRRWRFRHPSTADLRAALAAGTGDARAVEEIFDQVVYGTASIDDRVAGIAAREVLPPEGTFVAAGKRTEVTPAERARKIADARSAWRTAHPGAAPGTGPWSWRSEVTVRRDGAPVPQLLRVRFADGSTRDVHWNDARRWARFSFDAPTRVVAAELDPDRQVLLDADKLNDSYAARPDGAASRRWSADVAALVQSFLALVGTL